MLHFARRLEVEHRRSNLFLKISVESGFTTSLLLKCLNIHLAWKVFSNILLESSLL